MVTSENAKLPIWINLTLAIIATFLASFEYLEHSYALTSSWEFVALVLLILGLFISQKVLKNRGIKLKLFPATKIGVFCFLLGVLSALFFSDWLSYLHDSYSPFFSYIMMMIFMVFVIYLGNKYPLSESVSKVNLSAS